MATALDMILRARRLLNAHGVGETLDTELANDGLEALNAMLDSWSIDGLMIYAIQSNTFTLTGAQTYTIGTGGTFNMARPDRIEGAYTSVNGTDYPLTIINNDQWNDIAVKNLTSTYTEYIKYEPFTPLGALSVYPKALGAITLNTYQPLQAFETLTEVLVLPRGYERTIAYCLAVEIAPETGRPVSRELMMTAMSSKAALQRINADDCELNIDPVLLGLTSHGNMLNGYNG
jgi:hypothetical protein